MKIRTLILLLFCYSTLVAQQNTVLLQSFFKDHLYDNSAGHSYVGTSFLPVTENEFDLNAYIRDSSKQYYTFTNILYKKHLIEVKGKNYYFTISPVFDFSTGKDLADTSGQRLYQNTRGFFIEGDLTSKFSFSSAFFENQGKYNAYQTDYYSSVGELYPNQSSSVYVTENAVIPGAARTKPFKVGGFDYAYAVGNMVYKATDWLTIIAGNTSNFIGDGYRSMLYSDNSLPAPFLRADVKISGKWRYNYLRSRLTNLMRKPASTTAEAYYEMKAYSVNYLTFQPNEKLALSLFEGIIWSKGDSITSTKANPLFYNPVPLVSEWFVDENELNSVVGVNVSYAPVSGHRFYGQAAIGNMQTDQLAFQLGYRGYGYFGMKNFMLQLEYNYASDAMYTSTNARLNYSHGNLPLAHPKGNGFNEVILRCNKEYKRFYADLNSVFYAVHNYSPVRLLPVVKQVAPQNGTILNEQLELGYRFNRKMNFVFFTSWLYRVENLDDRAITNQFTVGIKTAITNHYTDF